MPGVRGPPKHSQTFYDENASLNFHHVLKRVMAAAAKAGPTDVHLELGGKSAMIVFDDVEEVEAAVDWACVGIFSNSGQVCRRVLVSY